MKVVILNLFQDLGISQYEIPKRVRDDVGDGDPEIDPGWQKTPVRDDKLNLSC